MCAKLGGVVRSALDRLDRDRIAKSMNTSTVLYTLPLSDLQGYVDALPLS